MRDHPCVRDLPRGTVTLLFTDIEGSTRLLQELGRDRYVDALTMHRRLLREAFAAHGGVEVEMQGDSFFFSYASAREAVAAAADAQRALAGHDWPVAPIRVRMGLHSGEPVVVDNLYAGLDVHRAARVMSAAHGGQVLLSARTAGLVGGELPRELSMLDLGEHRLKDLLEPEGLYQLVGEGLEREFPPPKTLEGRSTNLPTQPTPLVGRERELIGLAELLGNEQVRLVTLTGPGGTGKTRLALQAAADAIEGYANGASFVNLAPLTDAELVVPTIAQTLGVKEQPGEALARTLAGELSEKELLLVLDNFEQVADAAPSVAELLASAPRLNVIVTSRASLHLQAEHEYAVPALADEEAVALFAARAQAVKASFSVNGNRPLVVEICRRLDRLPLAIELAAARIKLLPEQALLARLDDKLKLLTGGPRDLDPRQRTLRAAIDWSYELLSGEEQALFRRLAVFEGGCSLEAIETVCSPKGDPDVLESLASLVDKSLLRQEETEEGEPRFVMLETIHEYAREKLDESGEADIVREAHLDHYVDFAAAARVGWRGADRRLWIQRVEDDQGNVRAALVHALEEGGDRPLRLVAGIWKFWATRGQVQECERWVTEALARTESTASSHRASAISAAAELRMLQGDLDRAFVLDSQAVAMAREVGDIPLLAASLCDLGEVATAQRRFDVARPHLEEALALREESGEPYGIAHALFGLADLELAEERYERAYDYAERARGIGRSLEHEGAEIVALGILGEWARRVGDHAAAGAYLRDVLGLSVGSQNLVSTAESLSALAALAAAEGRPVRAATLWGASEVIREDAGLELWDVQGYEASVAAARKCSDAKRFSAAWEEGRQMTVEEAVTYAGADAA